MVRKTTQKKERQYLIKLESSEKLVFFVFSGFEVERSSAKDWP